MKPFLLIGCLAFLHCASAQEFKVDIPKIMKHPNVFEQHKAATKPINMDSLVRSVQNFFTTKHHSGLYDLPQDHMPCVVPDTEDIAIMPNAWLQSDQLLIPAIPNPGLRKKPLVEKPKDQTK